MASWESGSDNGVLRSGGEVRSAGGAITYGSPTYSVTFTETGLPAPVLAHHGWYVYIDMTQEHPTSTSTAFNLPAGTYSYQVSGPANYVVSSKGDNVSVSGPTTIGVTFEKAKTYEFSVWVIAKADLFIGYWSTTTTTNYYPNGVIANTTTTQTCVGINVSASELWVIGRLLFLAYEPPSGTGHGGVMTVTTVSYSNFTVGNGWSRAVTINGKPTSNVSGTINLTQNIKMIVTVSPNTYPVTFSEDGLSSGHSWSVTAESSVIGKPQHGKGSAPTIAFSEPNGTLNFTIGTVKGYTSSANPSSPCVVAGKPIVIVITFVRGPP